MRKLQTYVLAAGLLLGSALPAVAQHGQRQNNYGGMKQSVQRGNYDQYSRDDERRHNHDSGGGIGPGKAALIGGAAVPF